MSIDVKNTDDMETDDKLGKEEQEEPLRTEGADEKMIDDDIESSDDETSYGSNSAYSRGGISSVTGGQFPHIPVYSPSDNSEKDSMEEVTTLLEQKLQANAALPPVSSPNSKTLPPVSSPNSKTLEGTDGDIPPNPKQE